MNIKQVILSITVGIPITMLYALLVRLTFAYEKFGLILGTMTCSFLFLVPLAIGALTIVLAPKELRSSYPYASFAPWISILIVSVGSIYFALEAAICILMAIPIFLILSSFGGIIFLQKENQSQKITENKNVFLGVILILPYLFSPIEMQMPVKETYHFITTEIQINSSAEEVWENIKTISYISEEEQGFSVFHAFDVPQLVETTPLTNEGLSGSRNAIFSNGLILTEEIIYWDEIQQVTFLILPSSNSTATAPYSMIGKEYFSVTEMDYRIKSVDESTVILYLTSKHKLHTRFNTYASFWTNWMLKDLQIYVLKMIKERTESK